MSGCYRCGGNGVVEVSVDGSRHWQPCEVCPPPVAHQSDENASTGVSEGYTRRNGAEKP